MKPRLKNFLIVVATVAIIGLSYLSYYAWWFHRAVINTFILHAQRIGELEKRLPPPVKPKAP